MRLHGHLVEIGWDGAVLDVRGTTAQGRELLNSATKDGRLVLPAAEIEDVGFRDAPRMIGGVLLVVDAAGDEHRLHFRRDDREGFLRLFEELDAAARRNREERPAIDLTDSTDGTEPGQGSAYGVAVSL